MNIIVNQSYMLQIINGIIFNRNYEELFYLRLDFVYHVNFLINSNFYNQLIDLYILSGHSFYFNFKIHLRL
jgi:hypothetical protein